MRSGLHLQWEFQQERKIMRNILLQLMSKDDKYNQPSIQKSTTIHKYSHSQKKPKQKIRWGKRSPFRWNVLYKWVKQERLKDIFRGVFLPGCHSNRELCNAVGEVLNCPIFLVLVALRKVSWCPANSEGAALRQRNVCQFNTKLKKFSETYVPSMEHLQIFPCGPML